MGEPKPDPKTWRDEPILAGMAFIAIFLLSLFVGVSILVSAAKLDPRNAAVLMLLPAAFIGAGGAAFGPTRKQFSRWYIAWS